MTRSSHSSLPTYEVPSSAFLEKANQGFHEYSEFIRLFSTYWLAQRSPCPSEACGSEWEGLDKEGQGSPFIDPLTSIIYHWKKMLFFLSIIDDSIYVSVILVKLPHIFVNSQRSPCPSEAMAAGGRVLARRDRTALLM